MYYQSNIRDGPGAEMCWNFPALVSDYNNYFTQ